MMFLTRRISRGPFTRLSLAPGHSTRVLACSTQARLYSVVTDAPVPRKSKVWSSADEAVKGVKSGDVLLCGGEPIST